MLSGALSDPISQITVKKKQLTASARFETEYHKRQSMALTQTKLAAQCERIQVEMEPDGLEKRVKIRLEKFDESLGWYPAGSLVIPLHQLPLLEQAVAAMRAFEASNEAGKIIPFPSERTEAIG